MASQSGQEVDWGVFVDRCRFCWLECQRVEGQRVGCQRVNLVRLKAYQLKVSQLIQGAPNATRAETKWAIGTCWGRSFLEQGLGCWQQIISIDRSNG